MNLKYKSVASINDAVRRVANRARNTFDEIQMIIVCTLAHVAEHGDITVAESVVADITKIEGITKSKVKQWFESALHATYESKSFNYDKGKSHRDIDLEQAAAVKWYNFKAENAGQSAKDLLALFESFHKAAKRSLDKNLVTQDQIDTIERAFVRASKQQDAGGEVIQLPQADKAA